MDKENANPSSVLDAVPSKHDASFFGTVPSTVAATSGASEAAAGGGQIPPEWYPYEVVSYDCPANSYETCMEDPWNKISQFASYFAKGVYKCPFCTRRLGGTNFNRLLTHAEDIGRTFPNVGATVNVYSFCAKHKTLGIHFRNSQRVEIAAGCMPPLKPKVPKIKGQGSKNWRRSQME